LVDFCTGGGALAVLLVPAKLELLSSLCRVRISLSTNLSALVSTLGGGVAKADFGVAEIGPGIAGVLLVFKSVRFTVDRLVAAGWVEEAGRTDGCEEEAPFVAA
jgi:hypothetical protein